MKPTKKTKRTKGRVMWLYTNGETGEPTQPYNVSAYPAHATKPAKQDIPVAVIPCATAKEARGVVKREAVTYSDRYDAVLAALRSESNFHNQVRAVLGALHLLP